MEHKVTIQAPILKATTALGAGGGASVLNISQETVQKLSQASAFLPNTLGEWLAAGSATIALLYSGCMFAEWLYKKIFLGGWGK